MGTPQKCANGTRGAIRKGCAMTTAPAPLRKRREKEAYEVRCNVCKGTVEVLCDQVRNSIGDCPRCGARLTIFWGVAGA